MSSIDWTSVRTVGLDLGKRWINAMQAAPLSPFRFAIAGLVFAPQNDGKRGMGAGHRRRLGNPKRGVDDPRAKVGEHLPGDHGREPSDPFVLPVVVG